MKKILVILLCVICVISLVLNYSFYKEAIAMDCVIKDLNIALEEIENTRRQEADSLRNLVNQCEYREQQLAGILQRMSYEKGGIPIIK